MSVLQKLTEGIVNRDLQKEGDALLSKWEKTGLLEGLDSDQAKSGMAVLLENQAKELLREASSMAAGDVEGFAAVAFPIVRRVFGGLIANQLVSVQPMSLPSGLIFFLDFKYENNRAGITTTDSVYGGGRVGSQITGGLEVVTEVSGGFYNLQTGYSSPTGSLSTGGAPGAVLTAVAGLTSTQVSSLTDAQQKLVRFDPDLLADTASFVAQFTLVTPTGLNKDEVISLDASQLGIAGVDQGHRLIRRLTSVETAADTVTITVAGGSAIGVLTDITGTYNRVDNFGLGSGLGSIVGADPWGLEGSSDDAGPRGFNGTGVDVMPEINIKVDSVAVTAVTKKLKAKWTPELAQDLNAYHNMDAEVSSRQLTMCLLASTSRLCAAALTSLFVVLRLRIFLSLQLASELL